MKRFKAPIAVFLTVALLLTGAMSINAWVTSRDEWDATWVESTETIEKAVVMTPGADETERFISWYSDSDSGEVSVLNVLGAEVGPFKATAVKTEQGDYRLSAHITGLNIGSEYTYTCKSGDWESEEYEIAPADKDSFTAMYVTDIHVGKSDEDPKEMVKDSYQYSETITAAYNKALSLGSSLDLIVSGGDQANDGLREEYAGLVANEYVKEIPFAMCIGNHDRKSVDYRYFNPLQSGTVDMNVKSFVGTDYYFVKGNALFLMMDSNNLSMPDHREFIENAINSNPDVKWRIAVFHHDLYSGRLPHRESENAFLRLMWAPLLDEYGFDLCLLGHSHYYTISNVMFNNKSVADVSDGATITDAPGTVYLVSGSINNIRAESDEIELSDNIGHAVLTQEIIYNLLDISENSITINSYTVQSDECIGTVTLKKTSDQGGHSYSTPAAWYYPLVEVISSIAGVINNIGKYADYLELEYNVSFLGGLFGK